MQEESRSCEAGCRQRPRFDLVAVLAVLAGRLELGRNTAIEEAARNGLGLARRQVLIGWYLNHHRQRFQRASRDVIMCEQGHVYKLPFNVCGQLEDILNLHGIESYVKARGFSPKIKTLIRPWLVALCPNMGSL